MLCRYCWRCYYSIPFHSIVVRVSHSLFFLFHFTFRFCASCMIFIEKCKQFGQMENKWNAKPWITKSSSNSKWTIQIKNESKKVSRIVCVCVCIQKTDDLEYHRRHSNTHTHTFTHPGSDWAPCDDSEKQKYQQTIWRKKQTIQRVDFICWRHSHLLWK